MTTPFIKTVRVRLGLSQAQMADMLGIGRARLSALENGANAPETLVRLATAYVDGYRPIDWP